MAAMMVEIECGLLTDKERQDCYWFPRWFSYTISEAEKRDWVAFLERNQLKLGYDTPPAPEITTTTRPVGDTRSQSQVSRPADQPSPQPQSQVSAQKMAKASTSVEAPQTEAVQSHSVQPEPDISTSSSSSAAQPSAKLSTSTIAPQVRANNVECEPDIPTSSSSSSIQPSIIQPSPIVTLTETSSANGPAEASPPKCWLPSCTETGPKICTGCKKARYCSTVHQLADWKVHKKECKGKFKSIEVGDTVGTGVADQRQ